MIRWIRIPFFLSWLGIRRLSSVQYRILWRGWVERRRGPAQSDPAQPHAYLHVWCLGWPGKSCAGLALSSHACLVRRARRMYCRWSRRMYCRWARRMYCRWGRGEECLFFLQILRCREGVRSVYMHTHAHSFSGASWGGFERWWCMFWGGVPPRGQSP